MAGTQAGYQFKLEGADALILKLQSENIVGKPLRKIFSRVGRTAKSAVKAAAPKDTGRLRASISTKMSGRKVPSFIAVKVSETRDGYSYPKLLEFSTRHGHRNWLLNAFSASFGRLPGVMDDIAREIAAAFRNPSLG